MIPIRLLKKIELGPRQMTFGFDDSNAIDLDFVYSFIEKECRTQGPVPLHCLIEAQHLISRIPEPQDILQAVFWLAEELKIHLYVVDHPVSPFQAKQTLLKNVDSTIDIVINQPVDENRFARAKDTAETFLPSLPRDSDQYTFSRAVANELESWHTRLTAYRDHAGQPNLPGKSLINNCIVLMDRLLEQKDSHAIILALVKYQSKIPELAGNVQMLSDFYTHKCSFWITFAEQMEDFKQNMEMIRDNKQIHSIYRKLKGILNHSHPFAQVEKAEQLLPELKEFHNRIEQEKTERLRKACLEQTDKMIRKLSALFDTFDAEDEYRNNTLHELRALNKKIGSRRDMDEIKTLFNDAKDLFVDIIETM
ncbi:hypothetical protein [Desulfobacter curvatus]|uniref:hypothetical protein n=1 Tax=Desulfobacter curvatus TaxID=2290 RepID=UPI00037990F4|nr:hypothetical protein [Desulfobacter curvatus]